MIILATSSQMRSAIHQTSADSAFFLRPHLTKEEYAYWTSHFRHFLHSCDKRTVTYQQREPSCCVRRTVKGLPCRSERTPHPCCDLTVLGDRTCVRPQQSTVEIVSKPQRNTVGVVGGKNTVDARAYSYPRPKYAASVLENGKQLQTISKENACDKKQSLFKRTVPSLHCTKGDHSDDAPDRGNHGANQQFKAAELRRKISERYLCGDQSYEDNPSALTTSKRAEKFQTRSTEPYNSTGTYAMSSELNSSLKRKSSNFSEYDNLHQGTHKKQRVGKDATHQVQKTSNKTIDLNDTLESFLTDSLPFLGSFGEEVSLKKSEALEISSLSGMAEETVHGDQRIGEKSTPINFDGNHHHKTGDAKGELSSTISTDDVPVKSQVLRAEKVIPKKCKNVDAVIKTTKPVQRKLLKDNKSSLHGSYALDYDCLPKLVSVLSSPTAKVASSLKA